MPSRQEVLMGLRAPAPGGLDTQKVLQALAGAAAQGSPNTSWGYGMRVEDAQREGGLSAQHRREQNAQVQQAVGNALTQDQQLYTRAMQAHEQVLAERRLALSEEAHAVEMQYKRAKLAQLPLELEAAKAQAELVASKAATAKRMSELTVPVSIGGKEVSMPLDVFSSLHPSQLAIMGYSTNPKMQAFQQAYQNNIQKGFSPDGAYTLSRDPNMAATMLNVSRLVEQSKKNKKGLTGKPDFGQVDDGTGKMRPVTEKEWEEGERRKLIQNIYPGLSDADLTLLLSGAIGTGTVPAAGAPVADDPYSLLLQGFANRYNQPQR